LIVLDDYFTYAEFFQTTITCALGVFMISASVAGYFLVSMNGPSRVVFALAGLLLVSPSAHRRFWCGKFMHAILSGSRDQG